jgi:hypothetical protein
MSLEIANVYYLIIFIIFGLIILPQGNKSILARRDNSILHSYYNINNLYIFSLIRKDQSRLLFR